MTRRTNRSGQFQFSEEGFRYYQQALDLIRSTAEEKGATMAQVCLSWMIRKKQLQFMPPIPGTHSPGTYERTWLPAGQ